MKHSKRFLALLLAVLLVGSVLAGCASKEDVAGTVEPAQSQGADDKTGTVTPAEDDEPAAPAEPEQDEAPEASEAEETVEIGRMAGGVYTNAYLGIGCELDENWEFYTAEELLQADQSTQELLSDSELGKLMADTEQFLDLQAENAADLTVVNVNYSKLAMQERVAYAAMSEEEIIDLLLSDDTAELLRSSYEQAGMTVESMEKVQVEFLGETHFAMKTHLVMEGIDIYNLQICFYQSGSYGVTVTLGSYIEDTTDSLLGLFYPL